MSVFEGGAPCETDLENIDSASVSDADTVQNTNAPSCHVEGALNDNELLKGLLTDTFCQVCEAVLLFESQRVSHYEGKKHAQRVRIFLQSKKAEKNMQGQECGSFQGSKANPERFCELCSMVFSSPVVAKSHYEGKVHAKNMKRSDPSPSAEEVRTTAGSVAPLVPAREETGVGLVEQEQKERTTSAAQEVDLSDPDKYCKLCTASFNNPHMAQQHYSGRKHQRNQARQEMISKLPKDSERVNSLTCPVCCVTLSSIETYQAHMQGNKHYVQEKKIIGLCKTQKKVYDSFQDELADYIQAQKARGLEPKAGPGSEALGQRKAEEGLKDSGQFEEEPKIPFPPPSHLPRPPPPPPPPLPFCPPPWRSPFNPRTGHFGFRGRFPVQNQWGQGYPLHSSPLIPGPFGRSLRRGRSPDSFSSSTSSDSSSFSSSSSNRSSSDSSKDRRRRRRKGKERTKKREPENDTEKDERRRSKKRQRREGEEEQDNTKKAKGQKRMSFEEEQETDDSNEWRKRKEKRYRDGDSSEEDDYRSKRGISKKRQRRKEGHHGKRRRGEDELSKESEGGRERGGGRVLSDGAQVMMEEYTEEKSEPKRKKEKKKSKEKMEGGDDRTEEEKLWDETILGMF